MRTTLTIDDDVAFALKKVQERSPKKPFKKVVNDALRKGLGLEKTSPKKKFKLVSYPMGLRPGYSLDNIEELLDQVEGPERR